MDWQELTPQAYAQWRQEQRPHTLLDVREDWEYATAHIEGAQHIPMGRIPEAHEQLANSPQPLVILCHAGMRSAQVADHLCRNGMGPCYNLSGGIDAWSRLIDELVPRY